MTRRRWLPIVGLLACLVGPSSLDAQSGFRHVSASDPTCGGHAPCYATIQAAVTAATAGEHVVVQAGTYHEQVAITGKNNSAGATEADRIVIEADPAAEVGSVVLQGAVTQCTNGFAIRLQQSKFITVRGLTITGAGGQAISLLGGINQNQAIHLERLRILGNGSGSCDGGITIARGNPGTLILNSLIYANGRNGVSTIDADGGPHYLIGNTIHGNQWSGVSVTRSHEAYLVNNAITGNGTATGSTGGRFGVTRESSTTPNPAGINLLNNLICGNRLGEINGPALDGTDSGNLTPTGSEGSGVAASMGCNVPANVYAHVAGADGVANTADDDFTPATGSPLLDAGLDPRTLGLNAAVNPLLEADYLQPAARPGLGSPGGTARFDIGAREVDVADDTAPVVIIIAPPADSYVRVQVPVSAQATDDGSGVATFTLRIGTQFLTTTLTPSILPPAPSVTANATWDTTAFVDGTYTLTAEAEDAAGNPGSATRVLIVDNTPPDTEIVTGSSGPVNATTATFTFTGTDNLTPSSSLVFAWRLDGGSWTGFSQATTATLTSVSDGPHTIEVKARDLAGNEDPTPAARSFSVDTAAPSITFQAPAVNAYVRQSVNVQADAVDANSGIAGLSLTVDGQPIPGVTLSPAPPVTAVTARATWDTTTTAEGPHLLTWTALDRAGTSAASTRSIVVDNTPPDTTIVTGPVGAVSATTVTFTFTGTDNLTAPENLQFAWRLDSAGFGAFTSATVVTLTGLTPGAHSFEVKARDLAGNEDPTAASRAFTVSESISVILDSPSPGQTVNAGQLVVRGRVISDPGPAGVVVNDVPASITGSTFAAVVFVDTVTTSITAIARNERGDTATTAIAISVVPNASPVTLRVAPSIGLAPVTVSFRVGGADPESVALDLDGNGGTDFVGSLVDQTFSYVTPGLYTPRVQFTENGANFTAEAIVLILSRTELDAVLQARWTAMKEALRVRDIPTALLQVAQDQRSFYDAVFNNAIGDLGNIDGLMTTFQLQEVVGHDALGVMVRSAGGVLESFEIRFRIDDDGVWRLWSF